MNELDFSDIRKMVEEAVNEANLGNVRPGAMKPAAPQAPQQVATTTATAAPATAASASSNSADDDDNKYFPTVSYCYRKNDGENGESMVHLGIAYIYDQHLPIIQKLYKKLGGNFSVVKKGKSLVEFDVTDDNLEDFKTAMSEFGNTLRKVAALTRNTKYSDETLANLSADINNALSACPTMEELEAYNSLVAKNWREMMNAVNDPSIKNKIKSLGAYYVSGTGNEAVDHQVSDRNKGIILMQDNNATYVTQEIAWNRDFNREIIDPSKFILVNYPNNKVVPKDIKEKVARKFKYGTYANFKNLKRNGTIGRGRVHAFRMECQRLAPGFAFTYFIKMYDIANTRVMPGKEDIFNTQEGFVNNLFGVPNSLANQNKAAIDASAQQAQANAPALQTDRSDTMLNNCLYMIIKACRNEGVKFDESGNVSEDIGSAIYQYEIKRANDRYHIPNPKSRETFAQSISAAVSVSLGIENAVMSTFYQNHGDMTDEEAQNAFGEFSGIVNAFSSKNGREAGTATITPLKMVSENINEINSIGNFNKFKEFLKQAGVNITNGEEEIGEPVTPQMMEENFFETLNKLEK